MTKQVARPRAVAKSADSLSGNQIPQKGNQISPVMQKVRSLLPAHKAAWHLAILIDEPLGQCQKLLCGERAENASIQAKLLRSWMGKDVLFVLMGDERPEWFSKYSKQLDLIELGRKAADTARQVDEALKREFAK